MMSTASKIKLCVLICSSMKDTIQHSDELSHTYRYNKHGSCRSKFLSNDVFLSL